MSSEDISMPVAITEDEASLYDRQIRLWGLEAQQKMRNATIVVIRLRGLATEVIKNIVLSGIGKLIVVDDAQVSESDLGAGFFFRDEDVGRLRVEAAQSHIQSLNPLVSVQVISNMGVLAQDRIDALISGVDLVCATDLDKNTLISINNACRQRNKPFYCGGTYGLVGYIFCDLLQHEHIVPNRTATKDDQQTTKVTASYVPLPVALSHKWTGVFKRPRQVRQLNLSVFYAILALWEFEARNHVLPSQSAQEEELNKDAESLFLQQDLGSAVLEIVRSETFSRTSQLVTMAQHELSPICAVVGGMLAQDILKTLAAKEAPIANFFVFAESASTLKLGI